MKINIRIAMVMNKNAGIIRPVHKIRETLVALTIGIHEALAG